MWLHCTAVSILNFSVLLSVKFLGFSSLEVCMSEACLILVAWDQLWVIVSNISFRCNNLDKDRATPEFKKKCLDLIIDIFALLPIPQARETFLLLFIYLFIYFSFISLYVLSISYSYTCCFCNLSKF